VECMVVELLLCLLVVWLATLSFRIYIYIYDGKWLDDNNEMEGMWEVVVLDWF
jgi:hypothetical protein